MPTSSTDIRITAYQDPATSQRITRLQFRGWTVEVVGSSVAIPMQIITGDMSAHDLDACLTAATALARQRRTPDQRPKPASATPSTPAKSAAVADILTAAHKLAQNHWHPARFDIYETTRTAWMATNMNIAFITVLDALRRVIPKHTRLIDINDHSTREQICALYDHAITALDSPHTATRGVA